MTRVWGSFATRMLSKATMRMLAPMVLAFSVAACGSIAIPLGKNEGPQVTGIARPITAPLDSSQSLAFETLGDADWEIVRKTVATSMFVDAKQQVLWDNPKSGTNGSIDSLTTVTAKNGATCRAFNVTMARVDGVKAYRALACQGYRGDWDVVEVQPADGAKAI